MADQKEMKLETKVESGSMSEGYFETPPLHAKSKFVVPWVRHVQNGIDILRNPKYNKGLAFTLEERKALKIEGLLPPFVISQDIQVMRVLESLKACANDLDRYTALISLAGRNERLFYRVLIENIATMCPLVYTPTVGLACQRFGHIFKQPRGLYVTIRDRGRVAQLLDNWPERHVRAIVFTDGERILGLGDLGAYGMGIPIGKLQLYTAIGGVDPSACLPVTIDVGTNNKALLADPMYTGLRQERDQSSAYDELIEEFIDAVKSRFGPYTLLQFEDFGNHNAFRLLQLHRDKCCTFNDDIQGTAAVVLAGVYAALPLTGKRLKDHVFMFYGAGSAGIGIANLIAYAISVEEKCSEEQARKNIWLLDSQGLIYKGRKASMSNEKLPYAHPHDVIDGTLLAAVLALKPSCLFGVCAIPQAFNQPVCEAMANHHKRPLIFALSNPTSKAECSAEQAYTWTRGEALFASGSPFDSVVMSGRTLVPGQGNNSYIFPGVALGVLLSGARRVVDKMFYIAAVVLAKQVTSKELAVSCLYPPLPDIRKCSAHIAAAVMKIAYEEKLATHQPQPADLLAYVQEMMYDTAYPTFVH